LKLLFTNFHAGDGGGHTTYVMTLAAALANRHDVHVAAPPGSRLYAEASAASGVHAITQPYPNGLKRFAERQRARRQLASFLEMNGFDVVHVNGSADHRLVMSAVRGLARRPRIVLTKHNSKPMTGIGHWWRARRATDLVIAVCEFTHRALVASPYRRCLLATVPNGIDTAHFSPWPEAVALIERRRRVGDAPVLLLGSNAGTARYKGWMDLVEALALLPAGRREQVHLLIAGAPPSINSQQRIDTLGLRAQVHFAGMLADVRPVVAAIDAGFVLSWDVETISFACREMMAMGKPVLVSDYAGLPENINPEVDGWCVLPRNHQAMAVRLDQLLDGRDGLQSMGRAARRHAERDFGIELFVARTETAYAAALALR
jgi:glycosyltransferase involved in cell wall biosynthesis